MRKKLIIIIISIILLLTTVFFSVYCIFTAPKYKGEFSIGDFSDTIELFPFSSNKNYGKIRDYKSAGQIGKNIINEFYGEYQAGAVEGSRAPIVDYTEGDLEPSEAVERGE